jgi:hypothetical protein
MSPSLEVGLENRVSERGIQSNQSNFDCALFIAKERISQWEKYNQLAIRLQQLLSSVASTDTTNTTDPTISQHLQRVLEELQDPHFTFESFDFTLFFVLKTKFKAVYSAWRKFFLRELAICNEVSDLDREKAKLFHQLFSQFREFLD